jgi:hypothetical protein
MAESVQEGFYEGVKALNVSGTRRGKERRGR